MQLQAAGAGFHLGAQRPRGGAVPFAEEADVDREGVGRLEHPVEVPWSGRAGGGGCPRGGAGAAAEHRGDAGGDRLVDLLGADEVDVGVDGAGGQQPPLAGDHLGPGADDEGGVDPALGVRVARLADADDPAGLDADVRLDDPPMVEDEGVGDHQVERVRGAGRLPHPVPDDLAAAERHLVTVDGEVPLDLEQQIGVGEPHAVARGWP